MSTSNVWRAVGTEWEESTWKSVMLAKQVHRGMSISVRQYAAGWKAAGGDWEDLQQDEGYLHLTSAESDAWAIYMKALDTWHRLGEDE